MDAIKGIKDSKGYVLRTGESQRNDGSVVVKLFCNTCG